jgi:hypothetical protein
MSVRRVEEMICKKDRAMIARLSGLEAGGAGFA